MTRYTLIFITFFAAITGTGQTSFEVWKNRGQVALLEENYAEALHALKYAKRIMPKKVVLKEKAEVYNNLGIAYYQMGDYIKAIQENTKSLEIYKQMGIDTLAAESMYNLAISYKDLGLSDRSMNYLLQAARIFEKSHSSLKLSAIWNSMGNVCRDMKEFNKAACYHYRSLYIRKRIGYEKGIADSYQNLGSVYLEWGEYNQAEYYLLKALHKKLSLQRANVVTTYSSLGRLYIVKGESQNARVYLTKAYELRVAGGNSIKVAESLLYLANYYVSKEENEKAKELFYQVEEIALAKKDYQLLTESLEGEITLLERSDDKKLLVLKYKELLTSRERSAIQANKKEVNRLEIGYDVERKNRELVLRRKQSKIDQLRFRQLFTVSVGIFLLAVTAWTAYYFIRRSKRKIKHQKEEIEYLHRELSHRTKNYFGLLSGMLKMDLKYAESQETVKVIDQIILRLDAMSLVQHYLLNDISGNNKEVELGGYFGNLVNTLLLNLSSSGVTPRFIDGFEKIYVDYDKAIRLAIVLNELVCNAIEHGLNQVNDPELQVLVKQEGKYLKMIVKDNGTGITFASMNNDTKGIVLIRKLLQYLGGALTFSNDNGCTATVHVKL